MAGVVPVAGRARLVCEGVLTPDLLAAGAGHDLVAEVHFGAFEPLNFAGNVFDVEVDAIPAARLRRAAVGHGRAAELAGLLTVILGPRVGAKATPSAGRWRLGSRFGRWPAGCGPARRG